MIGPTGKVCIFYHENHYTAVWKACNCVSLTLLHAFNSLGCSGLVFQPAGRVSLVQEIHLEMMRTFQTHNVEHFNIIFESKTFCRDCHAFGLVFWRPNSQTGPPNFGSMTSRASRKFLKEGSVPEHLKPPSVRGKSEASRVSARRCQGAWQIQSCSTKTLHVHVVIKQGSGWVMREEWTGERGWKECRSPNNPVYLMNSQRNPNKIISF